jgi:hypothetical protein
MCDADTSFVSVFILMQRSAETSSAGQHSQAIAYMPIERKVSMAY